MHGAAGVIMHAVRTAATCTAFQGRGASGKRCEAGGALRAGLGGLERSASCGVEAHCTTNTAGSPKAGAADCVRDVWGMGAGSERSGVTAWHA